MNNKFSQLDTKQHYKMYKAGKRWLVAGISVVALGSFLAVDQVNAATTDAATAATTSNATATLQPASTVLPVAKSTATSASTANSNANSLAKTSTASAASTTASSAATASQASSAATSTTAATSNTTNKSTAVSSTATATASNDISSTSTAATGNTTTTSTASTTVSASSNTSTTASSASTDTASTATTDSVPATTSTAATNTPNKISTNPSASATTNPQKTAANTSTAATNIDSKITANVNAAATYATTIQNKLPAGVNVTTSDNQLVVNLNSGVSEEELQRLETLLSTSPVAVTLNATSATAPTTNLASTSAVGITLNGSSTSAAINLLTSDTANGEAHIVISGHVAAGDSFQLVLPYGLHVVGYDHNLFTVTPSGSATSKTNPETLTFTATDSSGSFGLNVFVEAANDYLQIADQSQASLNLVSGATTLATIPITFTNPTAYTTTQEITRVQPTTSDTPTVTTGEEYGYQVRFSAGTYNINGGESNDSYRTQLANIVVTIPVPAGFQLDAANSTLLTTNGLSDTDNKATFTQDGVGSDVIVTYPATTLKSDIFVKILGSYVTGTPTDGDIEAASTPSVTGTFLGTPLTVTATTPLTDNLTEPTYSSYFSILNSNESNSLLLGQTAYANHDKEQTGKDNNLLFMTNFKNLSNHTVTNDTLVTVPNGLYVTSMRTPTTGNNSDSYPAGTTFTITAIAWDGTPETKTIGLGELFKPDFAANQGVASFEVKTNLAPGIGYTGTYVSSNDGTQNFHYYGYVIQNYQNGTAVTSGTKLVINEKDLTSGATAKGTVTATDVPVSAISNVNTYTAQNNDSVINTGDTITALYNSVTNVADTYEGPENETLPFEPIVYIVAPAGTSFAGNGDLSKALTMSTADLQAAKVTQLADTADGRQVIELNWTGTGISPVINGNLKANFVVNADELPGDKITVSSDNDGGTFFITSKMNLIQYTYNGHDYAINVAGNADSQVVGSDWTVENNQLYMDNNDFTWLISAPSELVTQDGLKNTTDTPYSVYDTADPTNTSATFTLGGSTTGDYRFTLYNGTDNALATAAEYVALPSTANGDAYGLELTGPVTTPASGETVLYSTGYGDSTTDNIDSAGYLPASSIKNWSQVRSFIITTTNLGAKDMIELYAPMQVATDATPADVGEIDLTQTNTVATDSTGNKITATNTIGAQLALATENLPVNYYLVGTTTKLAASTTLTGNYSTAYTATAADIANYTLVGAATQKGTFAPNGVVNFYYQLNATGNVPNNTKVYANTPVFTTAPVLTLTAADGTTTTYQLQTGDYVFTQPGQSKVTPITVGTYTLALTAQGLKHLAAAEPTLNLQNATALESNAATDTITPAKASLTADSASYVYDGQAHSLTITPNGLLNGDTLTYSVTGNSRTNAGSNAVTLTLAENNTTNSNYTVTLQNGTLTVTPLTLTTPANPNDPSAPINPTNPSDNPQLTTSLVVQGATKVYDGTANTDPTTYTVLAPSADKDFVVPKLTASDFDLSGITSQNVGSYSVKLSAAGITKLQNANSNYDFTAADVQSGLFTITPAKASLTADSASYVYDGQAHSLTITPNGLLNGDTLTYSVTGNSRTNAGSNAVTLTLAENNTTNSNYTVTLQNGTLTVTPAKATLTADSASYVYDGQAHSLTITPNGLLNGDTLTYSVAGNSRTNAGSNAVTLTLAENNTTNSNYTVTLQNGTLTVTPLALTTPTNPNDPSAPVNPTKPSDNPQLATSLVVQGATKVYDGTASTDPTTYTVLAPSADKDFVVPQLTASDFDLSGITSQNVGHYTVKLSVAGITKLQKANSNYDFTAADVQSGLFTITPAKATLTADSASYVYDGQAHSLTITPNGLLNGDTLTYSVAGNSRTNAGSNTVILTLAENNTTNSNYTVTLQNGTLTVTPLALTTPANPNDPSAPVNPTKPSDNPQLATSLVVQGATKVYDGTASTDPTTYTVLAPSADKSFVVPQLTASDFDLSGITSQNVGSYTVKLSTAGITKLQNANPNYDFTAADVQSGLLTIIPAKATLTADSASYVYDGQAHSLTITPTGLLNGDTLAYSVTGNSRTNVGSNTVTLTLTANNATNSNYTVTLQNGILTVTPAKTTGDNNTGGNTDTTTGNNTTGNNVGTGTTTSNNTPANNGGTVTGNKTTGSAGTVTSNNTHNTTGTATDNNTPANNMSKTTNNNTTSTINLAKKQTGNTTLTKEKSTKKTNTTVAGSVLSKLPQTGEATGERTLLATIGVMLLTGILGIFDQKRKHEKE
ncbi:hypothetical protein AYR56_02055 [Loigolactobacillus backii]|uniref:Gram-positive cocci surface proteins LPxTG domain-containing protein n=2 Tax=Loigolactobacillus backii TaxID=375175 RepID=A0A192H083_9LACO|nr:MBG domain-containing protein [Loigolactobacillus backii]ANK61765.1 hypothetical protein AYR53_02665 [Loigolactobacillus backii]ANK69041.1 hypothetical protein AYR56_02055 [Loigolactobacillus backii]